MFAYLLISSTALICYAVHDSLNLIVQPKRRECFYEDFIADSLSRTIETFVQSGGNLDITLQVFGPITIDELRGESFENPIIEEKIDAQRESLSESQTFTVDFSPTEAGTYAFCLDNRKAHFIPKIAQIDVYLTPREEEAGNVKSAKDEDEGVQRINESIKRIRKGLAKIQLQQRRDRYRQGLHSETNENSHNRVVIGSLVETVVFIAASLFQIFFVRRWFSARPGQKQWA